MMRELMVMFFTIFFAELGDKTQIATLAFAAEGKSRPIFVFAASAGALALGAAVSVIVGTTASRYLEGVPFKLIAGVGFILIGVWTIIENYRG
jgi:putative Ca2+/H+ antiporter (TMEM165/GDT1 family)